MLHRTTHYAIFRAVSVFILAPVVLALAHQTFAQQSTLDPAFERTWARADYPVAQRKAQRSWLWGPAPLAGLTEPWEQGGRKVAYYDKGRMEIGNPNLAPESPWYVTSGLLVVEMMSGRVQAGADTYQQHDPAPVPVAGDATVSDALTYAALAKVASLSGGQNAAQDRTGQPVTAMLSPGGSVTPGGYPPANAPRLQHYEKTTAHNIPDVFWSYINAQGTILDKGQYRQDKVFDWLHVLGYPLTEPYWTVISINGQSTPVMLQAFQRRILTYNPTNRAGWQVEMGNVGAHYYAWRYGALAPRPAPGGPLIMRKLIPPDQPRSYSGIHTPLTQVITDQASWETLWRKHTSETSPAPPPPFVDFAREFVIASFWGDKPNSCYRLNITSTSIDANSYLRVALDRQILQGTCLTVITQPHDFAAIARAGIPPGRYTLIISDAQGSHPEATQVTLP